MSTRQKMDRLEPIVNRNPTQSGSTSTLLGTVSLVDLVRSAFTRQNAVGPRMLGLKPAKANLATSRSANDIELLGKHERRAARERHPSHSIFDLKAQTSRFPFVRSFDVTRNPPLVYYNERERLVYRNGHERTPWKLVMRFANSPAICFIFAEIMSRQKEEFSKTTASFNYLNNCIGLAKRIMNAKRNF